MRWTTPHRTDRSPFPRWINSGGADAARTVLVAIASAVITVVGVVFSITILALTLASTQFGPRMLRNFIRDIGTQITLGTFVATFVFCILTLGSVSSDPTVFVPHLGVTVALGLTLLDLCVLIYFIHHVAWSIQITNVIHGIAKGLGRAIDTAVAERAGAPPTSDVAGDVPRRGAAAARRGGRRGPRDVEWLSPGDRPPAARANRANDRTLS